MGDVSGMAEKMQSFFLQEVLSRTHCVLKEMLEEVLNLLYQRAPSCFTNLMIAHTNVSICYVQFSNCEVIAGGWK
jgi:hypothetical protein